MEVYGVRMEHLNTIMFAELNSHLDAEKQLLFKNYRNSEDAARSLIGFGFH